MLIVDGSMYQRKDWEGLRIVALLGLKRRLSSLRAVGVVGRHCCCCISKCCHCVSRLTCISGNSRNPVSDVGVRILSLAQLRKLPNDSTSTTSATVSLLTYLLSSGFSFTVSWHTC